jgi:hypothetical protein
MTIKPQLFYLLWPALGLWVILQRRWKLVFTSAALWLLTILILILINPNIFLQYFTSIQTYPYDQWATPTIGSYLRYFWLGVENFAIQYLPAAFGIGWIIMHYLRNRNNWIWREQLPILSLISILTTPYAWTYDQIIFLPAILTATLWLSTMINPFMLIAWSIYLVINLADLLLHTKLDEFWFLWLAPVYTLWYLIIYYVHKKKPPR